MRRNYNKVLTIMLVMIIIAVVGLIAFIIFKQVVPNFINNKDGGEFYDNLGPSHIVTENPTDTSVPTDNTIETTDQNVTDGQSSSQTNASKPKYKGFTTVGAIEIPKTGLKCPVLEKVTVKSLETAVAVIWPQPDPVLNSVGNVVIVGHNYRNGTFFSNNKKIVKGDKIKIKDLDGKVVTYVVYDKYETSDTDTKSYTRDTKGKREITLSTCTDDSKKRIIILAKEE